MQDIARSSSFLSYYRFRFQRAAKRLRDAVARSGPFNIRAISRDLLYGTSLGQDLLFRFARGHAAGHSRDYMVQLPAGYPARTIRIGLSVPNLPPRPALAFSDHPVDAEGSPTETVLAVMRGGFGISHDLGESWNLVKVRDRNFRHHHFIHAKAIGSGEILAQVVAERWHPGMPRVVDNLVLNDRGEVLARNPVNGSHWHGCRSVDTANGILMYAEYPYEDPAGTAADRAPSRVFRSRDRGRSWQVVFERDGTQVRHFHFLQARPNVAGEWWLTSGDKPFESRIWVTKDDGDHWSDITAEFGETIPIDGLQYPRTIFRLTDLRWQNDAIVWGTDDFLARNRFPLPGARMFRSRIGKLDPRDAGKAQWPIRSIVEVGPFYMVLTQGCVRPDATPQEKMPAVYLMPKERIEDAPDMIHLFDVDVHSQTRTGFTYSRASRAAKDGTFFSYRANTDAFPFGHKILKWDVTFS